METNDERTRIGYDTMTMILFVVVGPRARKGISRILLFLAPFRVLARTINQSIDRFSCWFLLIL